MKRFSDSDDPEFHLAISELAEGDDNLLTDLHIDATIMRELNRIADTQHDNLSGDGNFEGSTEITPTNLNGHNCTANGSKPTPTTPSEDEDLTS
ncbi:MAG: hypothetical protein O7G85_14365 [Planctomycetota bacterium]|nr:hypothetical protein [Planctomycetota bacterium]